MRVVRSGLKDGEKWGEGSEKWGEGGEKWGKGGEK